MKKIIYTLITILTLIFCFYIISNKVYAHNTNASITYLSNGCNHVFPPSSDGKSRCQKCGYVTNDYRNIIGNSGNPTDNFTEIIIIIIVFFVIAIAAYIALSIRKKIKDKQYYSNDD